MHWWNGDWHVGWMTVWWLLAVVLIAVVVWVLVRAGGTLGGGRETPEQILKRRYASGEIDRETYQRMLTDLG
jgi:putative membrane protein